MTLITYDLIEHGDEDSYTPYIATSVADMMIELYRLEQNYSNRLDFDPQWAERIREEEVTRAPHTAGYVWIAYDPSQEEPIGFARCEPREFGPTVFQRSYIELTELFVYSAHRGKEVGKGLLNHSIARAEYLGYQEFMVYTHAENLRAKDFYSSCGLKVMETVWRVPLSRPNPKFGGNGKT